MRLKKNWKPCIKKYGLNAATLYLEKKKFVKDTVSVPAVLIGALLVITFTLFMFFR